MKSNAFMENGLRLQLSWYFLIVKRQEAIMKKHDKPMNLELYYCLTLLKHMGPVSMMELADQLQVSKQRMTQLINTLYDYGYIERIHGQSDRRRIEIAVTPAGLLYLEEFISNTKLIDELHEKLTDADYQDLEEAMDKLIIIMQKLIDKCC